MSGLLLHPTDQHQRSSFTCRSWRWEIQEYGFWNGRLWGWNLVSVTLREVIAVMSTEDNSFNIDTFPLTVHWNEKTSFHFYSAGQVFTHCLFIAEAIESCEERKSRTSCSLQLPLWVHVMGIDPTETSQEHPRSRPTWSLVVIVVHCLDKKKVTHFNNSWTPVALITVLWRYIYILSIFIDFRS